MERLPTELVIQILGYLSKKELKVIGFISSEYRSLVLPFLFRRIRLWSWQARRQGVAGLIMCLQNNVRLSSAIRVLDAEIITNSRYTSEGLRRILEIATWCEELILPAGEQLPIAVFDDNTKLRLCRLTCALGAVGAQFRRLLVDILPACTNLVDLQINDLNEDWFKTFGPAGSAAATWMNRLGKYRGPSYPLNYLHNRAPLYQLTSTTELPSPILQRLGPLVGHRLVALYVYVDLTRNSDFNLIGKNYLPPLSISSSFPNLKYVGWFLIMSQPGSAPGIPVRSF